MARAKAASQRDVRCYLCGHELTVSARAMSTTCPGCHKAIKIEDVLVKSYIPVVDLQTCGRIRITKRGRVAAKRIQSGAGITCEGAIEGAIETDGDVHMGPKSFWKGTTLMSRSLEIAAGAKLVGVVTVPWHRPGSAILKTASAAPPVATKSASTRTVAVNAAKVTATKTAARKVADREVARKTVADKTTPTATSKTATKGAAKKTKRAATKKTAANKAAAKKTAAKKTAAKKTAAKKKKQKKK